MKGYPPNSINNSDLLKPSPLSEHGGVHVYVARHAVLVRRRPHPRRRRRRLRRKHLLHPHSLIQVSRWKRCRREVQWGLTQPHITRTETRIRNGDKGVTVAPEKCHGWHASGKGRVWMTSACARFPEFFCFLIPLSKIFNIDINLYHQPPFLLVRTSYIPVPEGSMKGSTISPAMCMKLQWGSLDKWLGFIIAFIILQNPWHHVV